VSDHRIPLHELAAAVRGHSIFSPSGSGMWAYCSGSLVPNVTAPDKAGAAAAEGTVAHGVGETWLTSGLRPEYLIGEVETVDEGHASFDIEIDEQMLDFVEMYVIWCACLPGRHFVETRVDFSDLTPIENQGGTADHAACEPGKLTITDLKYGIGVRVYARNNTQALLYAYGFFQEWDWAYDFQTIVIRICQPRLDHFDEWEIARDELLGWAAWLKERAYAAWCYDAPRTPGEKQCQFCKIKPDCKAFVTWVERLTDGVFDDLDDPITAEDMEGTVFRLEAGDRYKLKPVGPDELTVEHKAAIFRHKSLITGWLEELGKDLYERLQRGEKVPGWKLVQGKMQRTFKNEEEAFDELEFLGLDEDDIRPREFRSPAQIEKELTRIGYKRRQLEKLISHLIKKSPGGATMVPESDPRPTLVQLADKTFDDLDEL
jgi:hypothetical protein